MNNNNSSNRADSKEGLSLTSVHNNGNYFTINIIRRKVENVDNQGDTARVDFHS